MPPFDVFGVTVASLVLGVQTPDRYGKAVSVILGAGYLLAWVVLQL